MLLHTADLKQSIDITKFNEFHWGRYDIEDNYNGRVAYIKDSKNARKSNNIFNLENDIHWR